MTWRIFLNFYMLNYTKMKKQLIRLCLLATIFAMAVGSVLPWKRAALAPALIPEILHLDPEIGLKQLRDRHEAELLEVPVDDPGVVADVDTPADYERLEKRG